MQQQLENVLARKASMLQSITALESALEDARNQISDAVRVFCVSIPSPFFLFLSPVLLARVCRALVYDSTSCVTGVSLRLCIATGTEKAAAGSNRSAARPTVARTRLRAGRLIKARHVLQETCFFNTRVMLI